jgi:hypothetical protein
MTEHDQQVEDMDVPESEADDVKGGSLNFTRSQDGAQAGLKLDGIRSQKVSWGG